MFRYALVVASCAALAPTEKFEEWRRSFTHEPKSYAAALAAFTAADAFIQAHNARNLSYTVGHNQFSHLTFEEWAARLAPLPDAAKGGVPRSVHNATVGGPVLDVDWAARGAVSEVKDQGMCQSCYSFSATGAIEGAAFIKTKTLPDLSEQMIVSCDTLDKGCGTGLMDNAFKWIYSVGGLCAEADYPYTSGGGAVAPCEPTKCTPMPNTRPTDEVDVEPDEESLASAVLQQPVSIGMAAGCEAFMRYKEGIFETDCGVDVNHAMLAVGFGYDLLTNFWKVKNSFGTAWGEQGYIRMKRSARADGTGICSIATRASYPTL